ncbi:MAG: response regulator [Bacteroidota bacterium]
MRKLSTILLVDDDHPTNFYHREIIREEEVCLHIEVAKNGEEALDYLLGPDGHKLSFILPGMLENAPEIIFLDINMHRMDGFEFLERFQKIPSEDRAGILVVMATTSDYFLDKEKAAAFPEVHEFIEKPITPELLHRLHREYEAQYAPFKKTA